MTTHLGRLAVASSEARREKRYATCTLLQDESSRTFQTGTEEEDDNLIAHHGQYNFDSTMIMCTAACQEALVQISVQTATATRTLAQMALQQVLCKH